MIEISEPTWQFLVHARFDIPWLLDEVERLQGQIDATRQMLRIECAEFDDNDWPDTLHLADVVEKHLARSAQAENERLRQIIEAGEGLKRLTPDEVYSFIHWQDSQGKA